MSNPRMALVLDILYIKSLDALACVCMRARAYKSVALQYFIPVHSTALNSSENNPLVPQTIITAQMTSIGGRGRKAGSSAGDVTVSS